MSWQPPARVLAPAGAPVSQHSVPAKDARPWLGHLVARLWSLYLTHLHWLFKDSEPERTVPGADGSPGVEPGALPRPLQLGAAEGHRLTRAAECTPHAPGRRMKSSLFPQLRSGVARALELQAGPRWLLAQVGHLHLERHSSQCGVCGGRCKPVLMTHPLAGGLGFPKEPHLGASRPVQFRVLSCFQQRQVLNCTIILKTRLKSVSYVGTEGHLALSYISLLESITFSVVTYSDLQSSILCWGCLR